MIKLEYLEKKDFKKIIEWNKDKSSNFLLQWAGPLYKYPLTEEQLDLDFSYGVNEETSDLFIYKIIIGETNEMIGTIALKILDKENKCGRVCKFLIGEESVRAKGFGKQVLEQLVNIGFNTFNLHRISLGVFDFNEGAIKCYEKVGFIKEGLLRDVRKTENGYWSLYEMSILEDEWKNKSL